MASSALTFHWSSGRPCARLAHWRRYIDLRRRYEKSQPGRLRPRFGSGFHCRATLPLPAFAEDLLELPALDFGGGATGKNAQQGFDGAIFIQWAAIKGGHQTEGTAGGVKERCAHVTLGGQLHQHPVLWKFPLNPSWIATQLLIDHRFARRAGQTVFEIVNNLLVGRDR